MKNNKTFLFFIMHIGFFIYSIYSLCGKFASKFDYLSFQFFLSYMILIFILFIYAIIWQQVLKVFDLSIATANKSATIIWGILWGYLFFSEKISIKQIVAVIFIIIGIIILSFSGNSENINE